jgi:hypothetical protein
VTGFGDRACSNQDLEQTDVDRSERIYASLVD